SSNQQPISLDPPANWMPVKPPPVADVGVLTWTKAELAALNQVFCSYTQPMTLDDVAHGAWMKPWTFYARNYYTIQQDMVNVVKASQGGAPSLTNQAWGSFRMVQLAGQRVLLLKSDMHLAQDGNSTPRLHLASSHSPLSTRRKHYTESSRLIHKSGHPTANHHHR